MVWFVCFVIALIFIVGGATLIVWVSQEQEKTLFNGSPRFTVED